MSRRTTVCPQVDREQYIRDNAVAMVEAQDEYIGRLRRQIARLENAVRALRVELRRRRSAKEPPPPG